MALGNVVKKEAKPFDMNEYKERRKKVKADAEVEAKNKKEEKK